MLVSVPFGGSARALAMLLSGDDFDIPIVEALSMRKASLVFLYCWIARVNYLDDSGVVGAADV